MSDTQPSKMNRKKQVVFVDFKSETSSTPNTINDISGNSMMTSNRTVSIQSSKRTPNIQLKKSTISQRRSLLKHQVNTLQPKIENNKEKIIIPRSEIEKLNRQKMEFLNNQIDLQKNEPIIENYGTLLLLDKIRQSASAESIGPMPLSLQACRFELPFDLKLLENLTPLDYLSKYCRLSSRRQYQFKRIFEKYRNRYYYFDSSYLYLSLLDIHKHNITHKIFNYLCQLIDLNNQQYQFTFDTYAGILTLCERILYQSLTLYKDQDDYDLTKDPIEKCDFYSLDRKFDGLIISDAMKRLLNAL